MWGKIRKWFYAAILVIIGVFAFNYLILGKRPSMIFAPSPAGLMKLGKPLSDSVESFYKIKGYYPDSLSEIGIKSPSTPYGKFLYRKNSKEYPDGFSITIGDYHRDGFVVYYSSNNKGWNMDG